VVDWVNVKNMMYEAMLEWCGIIFDLYSMCLAWDDNYFEITCGMLMVKEFQGKFLVMMGLYSYIVFYFLISGQCET